MFIASFNTVDSELLSEIALSFRTSIRQVFLDIIGKISLSFLTVERFSNFHVGIFVTV